MRAILLALAPLALYGQTASVQGTVTAEPGGQPIAEASINLMQNRGTGNYTAISDKAGHFTISGVSAGEYRVQITRNGYVALNYTAPITVPGKDLDVRMAPQAVITGRVLDQDGDAMANARVAAYQMRFVDGRRQPGMNSGQTNDLGEYRIFGLASGAYHLSATPMPGPGPLQWLPVEVDAPITVAAGASAKAADIRFAPAHTFHVRGHISSAIPGQHMYTLALAGPHFSSQRPVDAKGDFDLPGVQPDRYTLQAGFAGDGVYYAANVPVEVKDNDVDGVTLTVVKPLAAVGKVAVPPSLKTADLVVHAQLENVSGMAMLTADSKIAADGTFRFAEIAPGRYSLTVENLPEGFYVKSPEAFEVKTAAAPIDVVIAGAPGSVTGKTAPNATVAIIRGRVARTTKADGAGVFTVGGLPPGDYRAYAWSTPDRAGYHDLEYMKSIESRGVAVKVADTAVSVSLSVIE